MMRSLLSYVTVISFVLGQFSATASVGYAQNLRAQSGIVAALSGPVRVISANVGTVARTGQKIFLNDIVETGNTGKLQIMLMDRTTMTIGPNTSIVIDEFIYDPGVERSLTATVLKGTFKLASPSLNMKKQQSRKINLPNAVVSIRGTELIGSVGVDSQNVVLLNGAISVANDGISQDIDRPNFGVSISNTGEISAPTFFSSEDMGTLLDQLENAPAQGGTDQNTEDSSDAADEDQADEDQANEDQADEGQANEDQASNDQGNDEQAPAEDSPAESGELNQAEASATEGEAPSPLTAPAFTEEQGEPPSEAEVVAAAEAIADGTADVNDLQTLARSGPESISAVASILGVEIDEETGEITGNPEQVLGSSFAAIAAREGGLEGGLEGSPLAIPGAEVTVTETGEVVISGFNGELLSADDFRLGGDVTEGFAPEGFTPESFAPETLQAFNESGFGGTTFGSFNQAEFERNFEASFESSFESSFETSFEMNFESSFDGDFENSFSTTFDEDFNASFESVSFDPRAFESLIELTTFEGDDGLFFFDEAMFEPEQYEAPVVFVDDVSYDAGESLDDLVTDALEEVIDTFSTDVDVIFPDHTFMPDSNRYRSWNGSEWATISQNFSSGSVSFAHNNAEATYVSGGSCLDCRAVVSSIVTIDFSAMEYQFTGEGTFYKPGYNPVSISETTPNIDLNYWELSSGSMYRLPNERELESTFDDATVHTLTQVDNPGSTIDATIDLDFLYDSQLEDNNNVSSDLGVIGYMEVEYTETGGSEVTLRTAEEAMVPQHD
ncbi:MAG: FecR domain-containing protein [Alphaproteobacteria bacterium]|nr:FecR domain-containing protein [Alphaproteobacteria bacterium]